MAKENDDCNDLCGATSKSISHHAHYWSLACPTYNINCSPKTSFKGWFIDILFL
jgi:hypothetical protein